MPTIKEYYTIRLHDTDAAGIIFFAHQFKMAHDVYERFMTDKGFAFRDRIARQDYLIPIVHAEADYHASLTVGDVIEIEMGVERIGQSSYSLGYRLFDLEGKLVGYVKTVHVTMDPTTRQKVALPSDLRETLSRCLREE